MTRAILPAAIWLSVAAFAVADDKTPFPEFTEGHVYVAGVPDSYDAVRSEINDRPASSPQSYYVVVIESAGTGEWATRDYVDGLYETWAAQAAQRELKFDRERSVVIVLAVGNRRLSVHPGTFLQNTYGLRGPVIDREIVTPHFVPYARAEDYATGLKVLVGEIEKWIANKEAAQAQSRAEAEARAVQLRNDALATLTAGAALSEEVQKELAEKENLGLATPGLTARLEQAAEELKDAQQELLENPQKALDRGQAIQAALHQMQSEMRQAAKVQTQIHARLDALDQGVADVEIALDKAARDGLATEILQSQAVALSTAIDAARKTLATNAQQALDQTGQAEKSLAELRARLDALPRERDQMQDVVSIARELEERAVRHLEDTTRTGADATALAARVEQTRGTLKKALEQGEADYRQALALLDTVVRDFRAENVQLSEVAAHHHFTSRTLPLAIGISILGFVALSGTSLRLFHSYRRRNVLEQLKSFKSQVVELSDLLDALKDRHKQLPVADPDFQSPMTGDTLARYQSAQDALGRYRERWLNLMDAWDRAQAEIDAEAPFGTRRLQAAAIVLREAAVPPEMDAIRHDCAEPLDRLERAHEEAASIQAAVDKENSRLTEQLAEVESAQLSVVPYQADLETSRQLAARAKSIVVADPLGAQAILNRLKDQLGRMNDRLKAVLQRSHEAEEALTRLQSAGDLATAQRAAGFLLCEPEGNPDPLLAAGRDLEQHAIQALNQGDAVIAGQNLIRAFALAERAVQAVKQQAQAKSYCGNEIPARRKETARLRDAINQARTHSEELERGFAPESWRTVAGNVKTVAEFVADFEARVAETAKLTTDDVQHFVRAAGLLTDIQNQQKEANLLLAGVGARLKELVVLREMVQSQLGDVRRRAVQVGELLRANTEDRPRSNQRYQAAVRSLDETAHDATLARPDWEKVRGRLDEVRSGFDAAEKLAREDIRLAEQATAEIAEAEREIRRARSFYKLGFSANVAPAEGQLQQARQQMPSQAYEQAVQLAAAARQSARLAYDSAVRQAEQRQMELDQERQRQEARRRQAESAALTATAVHQAASLGTFSAPTFASSSPAPAPSPPPPMPAPDTTSTTAWTSGSSQTGW
jgi:uncharacterized membrane protein YgcG